MTFAKLRDLLEALGQLCELAAPPQPLDGAELIMRSPAGAHEIGVVGVCESVRTGPGCGDHGTFLEEEHGLVRPGECQHVRDRLHPLRIRDGMTAAVENTEVRALFVGDAGKERGAVRACAPDLEVRRARPAEGSAAEERASHIRTAAAGPRDHSPRGMLERGQARTEDAGLVEDLKRAVVSCHMELVAGPALERAAPVGPDLRSNPESPQQTEGAAGNRRVGDVEVNGDLTSSLEVHAPRRMEEPGQLRESIALASRGDRRELVPEILRE